MTVYNGERYLESALNGLRNQTFRNFEVIIVDDGSNDKSREIISHFVAVDNRFKLISTDHIGRAAALNVGLKACRGEFIAVNDADDISMPNRLEVQVAFLRDNPHVVLVGGYAEIIDEQDRIIGRRYPPLTDRKIRTRMAIGDPIVHSTVMYRHAVLDEIGGFNEDLPCAIDYDAIERCLRKGAIACIPEVLVRHRRHRQQQFRSRLRPQLRWRVAAKIAVRAAWNHACWMLPLSVAMFIMTLLPLHQLLVRGLQLVHTRVLHGREAI